MRKDRLEALHSLVLADGLICDTGSRGECCLECLLRSLADRDSLLDLGLGQSEIFHDTDQRLAHDLLQVTRHCSSDIKNGAIAEALCTDVSS